MLPLVEKNEPFDIFLKRCITFMKKEDTHITTDVALDQCLVQWNTKDMGLDGDREIIILSLDNNIANDNKIQEIMILPKKEVYIEKYKRKVNFDDVMFNEIISNFNNVKLSKPFMDDMHKLGISFADITGLTNKSNGLYAKIELNDLGMEAIKDKRFSYISPLVSPKVDTEGKEHNNVLWAVTLTNVPALEGEIPKLQDQLQLSRDSIKSDIRELKNKFKFAKYNFINSEGSMNYKELLAKIEGKVSSTLSLENGVAPDVVTELLNMAKDLVGKLEEALSGKEEAEGKADTAEKVAMEATTELSKIKDASKASEKDLFFKEVVKSGQVEMKELELMKEHYDNNEKFVKDLILTRPKKEAGQMSSSLELEKSGLSKEDEFIMKDTGYDVSKPEEVQKYKEINDIK